MKWKTHYKARSISPEEAAKHIRSGERIFLGSACGTPDGVIDAILDRADELQNIEMSAMVSSGKSAYTLPEYEKSIRHNAFFVAPSTRPAMDDDRCDFTPFYFGAMPKGFRDGTISYDTAIITVTPPDKVGNVSMGVSVSYDMAAAKHAKRVIAEVTDDMPFTLGDSLLRVEDIDYFVRTDRKMVELPTPEVEVLEQRIGEHIASLMNDGDCLQLGYGGLPNAVLSFLEDKNDLGIHSEMISDNVMHMVQKGIITGKAKTLNKNKITICVAMGSREFYQWMDYNTMIDMHSVEYTNDPYIIGQNDNMVSINSALTVDLLGQAAADMQGPRQFAGVGGQVDFARGCRMSKNGRFIIALPSTGKGRSMSRITPSLQAGQAVATNRFDIDIVVTEHGIASLYGLKVKDRARALIEIADPKFRDQLKDEFKELYGRKSI
ncbi:acetyl-CoA hydrolase/transferase family protein [Spirochaetota bacterium]